MTKTDHREYIASAWWQKRRKQFLLVHNYCAHCEMPRWLASIVYDQDLHVHHVGYANYGAEPDEDLMALCRRCHDIETHHRSELKAPPSHDCAICGHRMWDMYADNCVSCEICTINDVETVKFINSDEFMDHYLRAKGIKVAA